jgi:hypothetical protein
MLEAHCTRVSLSLSPLPSLLGFFVSFCSSGCGWLLPLPFERSFSRVPFHHKPPPKISKSARVVCARPSCPPPSTIRLEKQFKKSRSQIQDSEPGEGRGPRGRGGGRREFLRSCCPIRSDFFSLSPKPAGTTVPAEVFTYPASSGNSGGTVAHRRKGVASCSGGTKPAPPYTRRPVPVAPHQAGIRRVPVRTIDLDHRVGGLCGGGGGGERRTRPRCDRIGFGWPGHSARPRGARVAFSFRWPLGLGERSGQVSCCS